MINPADATIRFLEELEVPKKLYLGSGGHGAKGDQQDQARVAELRERWLAHWLKDFDFQLLTTVTITDGSLEVRLDAVNGGGGNDFVLADAVALNQIPEPSTWMLMATGLVGLALARGLPSERRA